MRDEPTIHRSNAAPGDVLIQLSYPRGDSEGRVVDLSIREQISGQLLVKARLSADQFADFMSSTGVVVGDAQIATNPERIGKVMENTSVSASNDDEAEQAEAAFLADGWDSVRIDRTNFGRRVVAYRWVEAKS